MARLNGKVAIVTGGARGMGAATARLFAAEGARVVIADIIDGAPLAAEVGRDALFHKVDVSSPQDWQSLLDATEQAFGTPDVLINNAAISAFSRCSIATLMTSGKFWTSTWSAPSWG